MQLFGGRGTYGLEDRSLVGGTIDPIQKNTTQMYVEICRGSKTLVKGSSLLMTIFSASIRNLTPLQDIRLRLANSAFLRSCGQCVRKQSAKISRLLKRLHIYGLIAKIPRSSRWRLTKKGWALLSAAVSLKGQVFPELYEQANA